MHEFNYHYRSEYSSEIFVMFVLVLLHFGGVSEEEGLGNIQWCSGSVPGLCSGTTPGCALESYVVSGMDPGQQCAS